jgi:hypothetical protein
VQYVGGLIKSAFLNDHCKSFKEFVINHDPIISKTNRTKKQLILLSGSISLHFHKSQEVKTMIMITLFIILVAVIAVGKVRQEARKSGVLMINADWLEDSEKFRLVTRWGIMG